MWSYFVNWELSEYVLRMNTSKAPGYDGITRKSLKILFLSNPWKITKILKNRYECSDDRWMHISKICNITKPNKEHLPTNNLKRYRPIACLSSLDNPMLKRI